MAKIAIPVQEISEFVRDLVLVRDHTSKCFMPKYKVDFRVVQVQGNRAEVKDNNGKLSWYHILEQSLYYCVLIEKN